MIVQLQKIFFTLITVVIVFLWPILDNILVFFQNGNSFFDVMFQILTYLFSQYESISIIVGFLFLSFISWSNGNHKPNKNKSFIKVYVINYPVILVSILELISCLPVSLQYKCFLGGLLGFKTDDLWEKCGRSFMNLFTRFFK